MGKGKSKAGGGGKNTTSRANTPSGISYDQFMKMSDAQKFQTVQRIINDKSITVPAYLDDSTTSKLMYGLGMNNKMTVVSEAQLDAMPGKDLYRTVYESGSLPPPSSLDILDQIRNGDYTQMSGKGGSAHGRALYFARDDFVGSRVYGDGERNAVMMRAKLNPNAKIVQEKTIRNAMSNDPNYSSYGRFDRDAIAHYAISHGIDGWYSSTYTMIVNRGVMTASSQSKSVMSPTKTGRLPKRQTSRNTASSWASAANV